MLPGADLPQLHGRHGHERDRPLHAYPEQEGGRRRGVPAGVPRLCALFVHQTQQPLLYPSELMSQWCHMETFAVTRLIFIQLLQRSTLCQNPPIINRCCGDESPPVLISSFLQM